MEHSNWDTYEGLRPVALGKDLSGIADLMELSFEDMDYGGRIFVRDMRQTAQSGLLLWFMQRTDPMLRALALGFVWVENGHVIGHASLYPVGYDRTWAIANVAVHPDYRRHGIGYAICQAVLNRIMEKGGRAAVLKVDAENQAAKRLYERLGFEEERTFTHWIRSKPLSAPPDKEPLLRLTHLSAHERKAALVLANRVRPDSRGGIGWQRGANQSIFQPGFFKRIVGLANPGTDTHWVLRDAKRRIEAIMLTESFFGLGSIRFDMLVHPDFQGQHEEALVNFMIRQAAHNRRTLSTEHPSDDSAASEALEAHDFVEKYTHTHMRCSLR